MKKLTIKERGRAYLRIFVTLIALLWIIITGIRLVIGSMDDSMINFIVTGLSVGLIVGFIASQIENNK